jgi:predicted RNA methylase
MDWTSWHERYESSKPLQERLNEVCAQITRVISKASGDCVRVISICAGDGRDLVGSLAALRGSATVCATLVESNLQLVAKGQAMVEEFGLADQIRFRCADATQSETYDGICPADLVILSGAFGNLRAHSVERLIVALQCLCTHGARVIWTRNLREFDDGEAATQKIRACFNAANFVEEVFAQTPQGIFAVGTHVFFGENKPLSKSEKLFEFSGFWDI